MKDLPVSPEDFRERLQQISASLGRVIVGQQPVIDKLLIAFFAGGHVLFEGVPGLGKTLLSKSFAQALGLRFNRIQCTPDLMPADILGTQMVVDRGEGKAFEFAKGPVFTHIFLADEINRTTPKTQSALLEAMGEGQVSIGGTTHVLEQPFFVMATQNPIEMEGTYPLPEAQLDRFFFKIFVEYPDQDTLVQIIKQTTVREIPEAERVLKKDEAAAWILDARLLVREVLVSSAIESYIARLVRATHGTPDDDGKGDGAARYLRYGASPRGAQAILMGAKVSALMEGRVNVSYEDVDRVVFSALNHRVVLSFEAEAEKRTSLDVLKEIVASVQK